MDGVFLLPQEELFGGQRFNFLKDAGDYAVTSAQVKLQNVMRRGAHLAKQLFPQQRLGTMQSNLNILFCQI